MKYLILPITKKDIDYQNQVATDIKSYIKEKYNGDAVKAFKANDPEIYKLSAKYHESNTRKVLTGAALVISPFDSKSRIIKMHGIVDDVIKEGVVRHEYRRDLCPDMKTIEADSDEKAIEEFDNFILVKEMENL